MHIFKTIGAKAPNLGVTMRYIINTDLDHLEIDHDDMPSPVYCYFDQDTYEVWHIFAGDVDIFGVVTEQFKRDLELEYKAHCKQENEEHALDLALTKYELNQL